MENESFESLKLSCNEEMISDFRLHFLTTELEELVKSIAVKYYPEITSIPQADYKILEAKIFWNIQKLGQELRKLTEE
ncbi:MAG: hypothetical protein J7604_03740 [Sporocytophaga sp.]|uniref:hypothetical protein n=1 Tax=Sporocytophaga sp. TaxID=2231183 RepID=UPI001B0C55FD|nr:hypothetical protein [Sporocytophaga sp.]MBO9699294.1 hypothetical protein [Sporocytophaga sp.]